MNIKTILFLICIVFLLTPLSACWLINQPTGYDTNIIEKLQKEVPFTIVVPTYFPEGIEPYPSNIGGPGKEGNSDEDEVVTITLTYREIGTDNSIFIIEENIKYIDEPSGLSSIYLDFAGIQVLEEEGEFLFSTQPSSSSDTEVLQLLYRWNRDGVHFDVYILNSHFPPYVEA